MANQTCINEVLRVHAEIRNAPGFQHVSPETIATLVLAAEVAELSRVLYDSTGEITGALDNLKG